jgi:hypothetical protein
MLGYSLDPKGGEMAELLLEETDEEETVQPQWERAECTCPDYCERDHELD